MCAAGRDRLRAPGDEEVRVKDRDTGDRRVNVEHREHRVAEQHQAEQAERRQALPPDIDLKDGLILRVTDYWPDPYEPGPRMSRHVERY